VEQVRFLVENVANLDNKLAAVQKEGACAKPTFKGIHDIPGLAIVPDALFVEGNINGGTRRWRWGWWGRPCGWSYAWGHSSGASLGSTAGIGKPIRDLRAFETSKSFELFFFFLGRVRMIAMLIHPIFQDLDGCSGESGASLARGAVIIFILGLQSRPIKGLQSNYACEGTLLHCLVLLHGM
jgi:hypothetical protein